MNLPKRVHAGMENLRAGEKLDIFGQSEQQQPLRGFEKVLAWKKVLVCDEPARHTSAKTCLANNNTEETINIFVGVSWRWET